MKFLYDREIREWTIISDDCEVGSDWQVEEFTFEELQRSLNAIAYDVVRNKALRKTLSNAIADLFSGETFEYYHTDSNEQLYDTQQLTQCYMTLLFALKYGVDEDADSRSKICIVDTNRFLTPVIVPRFEYYVEKPTDAVHYYRVYGKYLSDGAQESILSRIEKLLNTTEVN